MAEATSSSRQYYIAVGNARMKLPTLTNLLNSLDAAGSRDLAVVIVCNSRDTLDELVGALSGLQRYACHYLHSDMHAQWRKKVLDGFNGDSGDSGQDAPRKILLSSDVCLPRGEPLRRGARLLINYDLPGKREQLLRRVSLLLGDASSSGGGDSGKGSGVGSGVGIGPTFINFLVANEASMLKSLENFASQKVEELPLVLSDIFE